MRSFLEGILKKIEARAAARLEAAAQAEVAAGRKAKGIDAPKSATGAIREDFFADALIERGNAYEDDGDADAALRVYRQAAEHSLLYARVHLNIGNALRALGRFDDARAAYERARELDPDNERALLNLGNLFMDLRDFGAAELAYREALRLKPDWSAAWLGIGCAVEDTDAEGAKQAYAQAARLDASDARAWISLAALERNLGEAARSVDAFRAALAIQPDNAKLQSDLLLTLNLLPEISGEALLDEHRKFGARFGAAASRPERRPAGEKLRVGFVSGDLRAHPVSFFIAPLWRNLDRNRFEVHAYSTQAESDPITGRLRALTDAWHDVAAIDDDALAKQIGDDRIDILIDLSGHTSGNRLATFAHRPAPVQMTWLGYLGTTGLAAMDYRICDRFTDPPGVAEAWQSEKPARLPNSQWCYQPQIEVPATSALPRQSRGFWTFGSFNQAMKLGPQVLHSWTAVLAAFPDAHLRVVGVTLEPMRKKILSTLGAAGIAANRIELSPRLSIEDYFAAYREVDVALDSFPYNGGTTTCDALLMGVPVAVVEGARSIARGGVSLLSTLGLTDWIARTPEELPQRLKRELADVGRIAKLRAELPQRMRASPLMDGPRFARDFEQLLSDAWTSR